jgi:hypothetical protein
MEKQTFDLKEMGLTALGEFELRETEGGWPNWVIWLGEQIISNWDDIKSGAKDGWNSVHYN